MAKYSRDSIALNGVAHLLPHNETNSRITRSECHSGYNFSFSCPNSGFPDEYEVRRRTYSVAPWEHSLGGKPLPTLGSARLDY